jgi:hypothetical protein
MLSVSDKDDPDHMMRLYQDAAAEAGSAGEGESLADKTARLANTIENMQSFLLDKMLRQRNRSADEQLRRFNASKPFPLTLDGSTGYIPLFAPSVEHFGLQSPTAPSGIDEDSAYLLRLAGQDLNRLRTEFVMQNAMACATLTMVSCPDLETIALSVFQPRGATLTPSEALACKLAVSVTVADWKRLPHDQLDAESHFRRFPVHMAFDRRGQLQEVEPFLPPAFARS